LFIISHFICFELAFLISLNTSKSSETANLGNQNKKEPIGLFFDFLLERIRNSEPYASFENMLFKHIRKGEYGERGPEKPCR